MKIGLVGPQSVIDRAYDIIKRAKPKYEIKRYYYNIYKEAPVIVSEHQDEVDGLIFAGKTPYKLVENSCRQTVPWEYLGRRGSTIVFALLKATYIEKIDLCNASFDTYTDDILEDIYTDMGIDYSSQRIAIAEQRLLDADYLDYMQKFHEDNYFNKGYSGCITGFSEIYAPLKEKGIPVVKTEAMSTGIIATVNRLEVKYLELINSQNQNVAMVIYIPLPKAYSLEADNEYVFLLNRNKILEKIYFFANKLKAVVQEKGEREFIIYTTRQRMETETENLENIYLFELLDDIGAKNVSIGVGYGATMMDARNNAYKGMTRANDYGGEAAYVVFSSKEVRGPIVFNKKKEEKTDKVLYDMSEATQISVNLLSRIYEVTSISKNNEYTSEEMAKEIGVSKRNMDRIILKLESVGLCRIVGRKMQSGSGRPSRIIQFNLS